MMFRAHVQNGRLLLDEPTDLPEGSEIALVPADGDDSLDDEDRARLHAAIERSIGQVRAGQGIPADEALRRLGIRDRE